MKQFFSVCSVLLISSLFLPQAVRADTQSGTWNLQPSSHAGSVYLQLQYHHETATSNSNWSESGDVPVSSLRGLSANDLSSPGALKSFAIAREAGEFRADGWVANGAGSGVWTFAPSASFRSALARRGLGTLSDEDALRLATANFTLSTLDALQHAGFQDISVTELVRMTNHGVNEEYIAAMRDVSPKSLSGLIRMHDHGVTLEYLHGLQRLGYHPAPEEIVRLADHGVSIAFIERMRAHGYTTLSASDLIRLRDHGF